MLWFLSLNINKPDAEQEKLHYGVILMVFKK